MAPVQIGWAMPRGAAGAAARPAFAAAVRRGLDLVAGAFDSAWMIDHLQLDGGDVLEGWTALAYFAAQEPRLRFPARRCARQGTGGHAANRPRALDRRARDLRGGALPGPRGDLRAVAGP